jgi:hypothetical protein
MTCPNCHNECSGIYECRLCDAQYCKQCSSAAEPISAELIGLPLADGPICPVCQDGRGNPI